MTATGESFRLESQQPSLPQIFEDLAQQVAHALITPDQLGATLREKLAVEGESLEQLLKEWVNALLDLARLQRLLFHHIRVIRLETPPDGPYTLQAEAIGEHWDVQRHQLTLDPAWLTCKTAFLRRSETGFHAEILLTK